LRFNICIYGNVTAKLPIQSYTNKSDFFNLVFCVCYFLLDYYCCSRGSIVTFTKALTIYHG
jgi:hypothetical protein